MAGEEGEINVQNIISIAIIYNALKKLELLSPVIFFISLLFHLT
jgi:hypothetical protein